MKNSVLFLKDSPINEWLRNAFLERNFKVKFLALKNQSQYLQSIRVIRIIKLHFGYVYISLKCLFNSNKDDIIVSLLDVIALYVFLFSKLFFFERKLVVINIMLNNQIDIITKIKKNLFKKMLKSDFVYPTITSTELAAYYNDFFSIPNKKFFLLHDCYGKLGLYKKQYYDGENYVFCGGTNGRDWELILKVAAILPNTKFVVVGPKKNTLGENYPQNIEYYYDIDFDDFQKLIEKCSVVALPLKTQAPAGLIVLYTAGLMSKPVITTDNITTREYITNEINGILVKMGNHVDFAFNLNKVLNKPELQKQYGEMLFNKIEELGSPQAFINKIIFITNQIYNENITNK